MLVKVGNVKIISLQIKCLLHELEDKPQWRQCQDQIYHAISNNPSSCAWCLLQTHRISTINSILKSANAFTLNVICQLPRNWGHDHQLNILSKTQDCTNCAGSRTSCLASFQKAATDKDMYYQTTNWDYLYFFLFLFLFHSKFYR